MAYKYKGREQEYKREWYLTHQEETIYRTQRWGQKLRDEVLRYYSGGKPRCAICEEPDPLILTIDHIEGGGTKHRQQVGGGIHLYRWLQKNNYPEGFQVLCQNCNTRKYRLEQIERNMEQLSGL